MKVIPCPHESGDVEDYSRQAPDYHPLNKEEIADLLNEAKTAKGILYSQIQIRLCQGIPGYVCPRIIDGPVADKESQINALYIEKSREGASPETVEQFYAIMTQ